MGLGTSGVGTWGVGYLVVGFCPRTARRALPMAPVVDLQLSDPPARGPHKASSKAMTASSCPATLLGPAPGFVPMAGPAFLVRSPLDPSPIDTPAGGVDDPPGEALHQKAARCLRSGNKGIAH